LAQDLALVQLLLHLQQRRPDMLAPCAKRIFI
jgi:hypothetical protein